MGESAVVATSGIVVAASVVGSAVAEGKVSVYNHGNVGRPTLHTAVYCMYVVDALAITMTLLNLCSYRELEQKNNYY